MSESYKEVQVPAKFFTHPFDARSVMLFASIAFTSAMAQAQAPAGSARTASLSPTTTAVSVGPALRIADLRLQPRMPVKKGD